MVNVHADRVEVENRIIEDGVQGFDCGHSGIESCNLPKDGGKELEVD